MLSELNVLNWFIRYSFPGLLSILCDFHVRFSTFAVLEAPKDDLASIQCNDGVGLLHELAVTLCECEALTDFFCSNAIS